MALKESPMEFHLDGYCGLYCGACPVMLGTKAGTEANPCQGCKSDHPAGFCAECGIKSCARQKGYEFCHECAELNACGQMREFIADAKWPHHQGVLKNLEAIKREGVEPWAKRQGERWRCQACGATHSWRDETCGACGRPVANYRADL